MKSAWDESAVFPYGAVRDAEAINVNEHEVIRFSEQKLSIHNHPRWNNTHMHTHAYNTARGYMDTKDGGSMITEG